MRPGESDSHVKGEGEEVVKSKLGEDRGGGEEVRKEEQETEPRRASLVGNTSA